MPAATSFFIDQIVHGYLRGHREIMQSVDLDDEARSTMVVMSDLLIDRVLDEQASYLTCYPLPSIARHVLARTWSAGPEYRPGSVWTHSLLIDYPALAQIHDLAELADLLRRPTNRLSGFGETIVFTPKPRPSRTLLDLAAARTAIGGVYGGLGEHVVRVPTVSDSINEALALALWRQAWPGLRRSFGFVTGVTDRPVTLDADCTLLFSKDQGAEKCIEVGHDALLADLPDPGPTALRQFLSRYVIESSDPRSAAPKVADIWVESQTSDQEGSATTLAKLARAEGLPRLKRDLIVAELSSTSRVGSLVDLIVEFADESIMPRSDHFGDRLTDLTVPDARRLMSACSAASDDTLGRRAYDELVRKLDGRVLASAVDDTTRSMVLTRRPDLAGLATFWPSSDEFRASLIRQLALQGAPDAEGLIAMFGTSIGVKTAEALAEVLLRSGSSGFQRLMSYPSLPVWRAAIKVLEADRDAVQILSNELVEGDGSFLEILCEAIVRSRRGLSDPHHWLGVSDKVHRKDKGKVAGFTAVLLIDAAFKVGGKSGYEGAKRAFETVLNDDRSYSLSREKTAFLENELPKTASAWSVSRRLIAAAIDTWPCGPEGAGALALCARNDNVREVVDEVHRRRGRSALEDALLAPDMPSAVADTIRKKLEPPKLRLGIWGF